MRYLPLGCPTTRAPGEDQSFFPRPWLRRVVERRTRTVYRRRPATGSTTGAARSTLAAREAVPSPIDAACFRPRPARVPRRAFLFAGSTVKRPDDGRNLVVRPPPAAERSNFTLYDAPTCAGRGP
jgi:hypothetical protein